MRLRLPLLVLHIVAGGLAYLFGPKEAKPWRETLSKSLKKPDEPPAQRPPHGPSIDHDALREAKIRDHEARVAAKIAAAKASEPPAK